MNKRGFLLVEVLLSLCIFGIVVATCLPILSTALNNKRKAKEKLDMIYIAETIMEQIKSFNYNWPNDYQVYSIYIRELMDEFSCSEQVTVNFPIEDDNDGKYLCIINKYSINDKLWKITVELSTQRKREKGENVFLWCIIQKPE